MSNDFETGVYIEPKGDAPKPKTDGGTCALSGVLNFIGVASIIMGVICACTLSEESTGYYSSHANPALVVSYLACGILSGVFNFALAVIVDACDKYRKAHKG